MSGPLATRGVHLASLRAQLLTVLKHEVPEAVGELLETEGSREAVEAWAARWHLRAEWLVDHAARRLEQWHSVQLPVELWPELFVSGVGASYWLPESIELVIRWQPDLPPGVQGKAWHAQEVRRYRHPEHHEITMTVPERPRRLEVTVGGGSAKTAQADLLPIVREYLEAVAEAYRKAGFGRPIVYRGRRDGVPLDLRLRALVWRCCGLPGRERPPARPPSWNELALALSRIKGDRVPRPTVERGVKRLAALLGLELP